MKELQLDAGNAKQLGVYYTKKDKKEGYSYHLAAYSLNNYSLKKEFDIKLYSISDSGVITNAYIIEVGKIKPDDSSALIWLYEADVEKYRAENYINKGPLLVKKKNANPQVYVYRMWVDEK